MLMSGVRVPLSLPNLYDFARLPSISCDPLRAIWVAHEAAQAGVSHIGQFGTTALGAKSTLGRFCTSPKPTTDYPSEHNNVVTLAPNRLALEYGFGRSGARWYVLASFNWEGTMAEAKLAPNLPDWMLEHANRYLASGGTDGHMYKVTVPQRGELTVPALLLTTTGRKSGDKFIFPLFYGMDGDRYFIIASKGGAPQHPGWYRNILANPDVEVQVGTKKMNARARTTEGEERLRLWEKALEFWPPYADYQLKTEREIPVVVLDPVH
jgi:deazaflavin-dependent oxidoreductase (nitroreductase family)